MTVSFVLKRNRKKKILVYQISFQVHWAKGESFGSGNGQVNRNCLNPLTKDIDLRLHSIGCSQDTIGLRSEKAITSCGSAGLLDLNETPVNEPVANRQQCFFQDLNFPYTEDTKMSSEKNGLDDVHGKDSAASPASCCTAENNSKIEREDSCEVIQIAAECLVYLSAVSFNQSRDLPFKHGSRSNSSSQDQDFLNKPQMGNEKQGYSCDSYELLTLGIRETSPEEDCCVSSKSKAVDEFNSKKEFRVKVRIGRRMKNFQKEILPGLVSLSRHEIREDINILEAVLRSRDYKKMQGKTTDGKCRPNLKNNKGLTQRYVGRRRRRTE